MHKARTFLTFVVTLSLAAAPVPVAAMQAIMAAGSIETAMSQANGKHCCPHAGHCDRPVNDEPMKTGCDHSGVCAAKCSALSAAAVAEIDLPPLAAPSAPRVLWAAALRLTQNHPPLPPPRV